VTAVGLGDHWAIAPFLDRETNLACGTQGILSYLESREQIDTHWSLAGVAFGMVERRGPAFNTSGMVRWIIAGVACYSSSWAITCPRRASFIFGVRNPGTLSLISLGRKPPSCRAPVHDCGRPGGLIGAFVSGGLFWHLAIDRPDPEPSADPVRSTLFGLAQRSDRDEGPALHCLENAYLYRGTAPLNQ